jgi:hypothetical protein
MTEKSSSFSKTKRANVLEETLCHKAIELVVIPLVAVFADAIRPGEFRLGGINTSLLEIYLQALFALFIFFFISGYVFVSFAIRVFMRSKTSSILKMAFTSTFSMLACGVFALVFLTYKSDSIDEIGLLIAVSIFSGCIELVLPRLMWLRFSSEN